MSQSSIKIHIAEENAEEKFAKICAALVREGVIFNAYVNADHYLIEFTGGF